eukprot:gene4321-8593_t
MKKLSLHPHIQAIIVPAKIDPSPSSCKTISSNIASILIPDTVSGMIVEPEIVSDFIIEPTINKSNSAHLDIPLKTILEETIPDSLKTSLTTDFIRRYPDPTRPFEVHTDASDFAIGAVLVQRNGEGVEQPLEYFSRSLSPAEINYTVTENACLAIVAAIKRFHVHLACDPFFVFTDHQALASLLTMKDPTRRIARWLITLGEYSFVAVYRKGSLNGDADALSRLPSELVKEPAVISSKGTIRTVNFMEDDFLGAGFDIPVVHTGETNIACAVYEDDLKQLPTAISLNNQMQCSVLITQSRAQRFPRTQDTEMAFDEHDIVDDNLPILDLGLISLTDDTKLIGRHCIDSIHGRECRTPLDTVISSIPRFKSASAQDYEESFISGLAFAKDIALEKLGIAHSLYNRPKVVHTTLRDIPTDGGLKNGRKHSPRQFEVGNKVMIWAASSLWSKTTKGKYKTDENVLPSNSLDLKSHQYWR